MKLVLATPLYPPDIGGPATDAAALEACLEKKGLLSLVCSFGSVRHLPKGIRHFLYAYRLFRTAQGAGALVAFDTVSVGVPAALVALLWGIPLVVRVPGDYAWEQGTQRFGIRDSIDDFQKKRYGLRVEFLRMLQRVVVKRAVLVAVPSDYFLGLVSTWGVSSVRLVRIYLGLTFNEKAVVPASSSEGKVLLSVGRFVPWKGFGMLIEILAELPREYRLVLVGEGPLRSVLETHARSLGVTDRVLFTGAQTHVEVLEWLRKANVFLLNTSFESFSFQLLEAMEAGIPIVTTKIGSIPELIESEKEGVLCTPNDRAAFRKAILTVEAEPEVWEKRTRAAKHKAKQFSSEASADALASAIFNICE